MPERIDRLDLDTARQALAETIALVRQRTREVAQGAAELERLRRARGDHDREVRAAAEEQARREQELERARGAEADAKRGLNVTLGEWVVNDPGDPLGRLRADIPIALLPVRIETRFASSGSELLLRVYPDTIHGTAHDPLLTAAERDAGIAFWQRAWAGDEAQAWRELVHKFPATRAAWIARAIEPTNLAARPAGAPSFPDVELRGGSWDRAAECHTLPDRWLVLAYRGGSEVHRVASQPVREPLVVGFDPHSALEDGVDVSGDGLKLDQEVLWAVDFAQAEAAGMAVRVPLAPADLQQGFDRILVVGVKGSLPPEAGQARLQQLFEAHHYNGGLAILGQGTPTNNTESTTTSYPPPDPDGAQSYAIERGLPLDDPQGDGARLMRALGLESGLVEHIAGADRHEQASAGAMNQALWPVAFGYYLQQLLAPHVSANAIELARHYFVDHVRGRGPLPAFRVRRQPYGALPVGSLDRWQSRADAHRAEVEITALLRRLRPIWQNQIERVHRVGRTADPDADLLGILGMDASTREVRVRAVHGPAFLSNLFDFLGIDGAAWNQTQAGITSPLMAQIGFPAWDPRLLHLSFAGRASRFRLPLTAPAPLSEETGLEAAFGFDYIRWIREASLDDLRDERLPAGHEPPAALLYRMLRHARLTEIARVAVDLQVAHGQATAADRHEAELVGIAGETAARPTAWQRLAQPIPQLTRARSLGEFLTSTEAPTDLQTYDAALETLIGLPTAELERLFGETLDSCSHRLDAWVTSLAARRLLELRKANPTGTYVGAFGWIEDLRPEAAGRSRTVSLRDGRTVRVPVDGGGYIHAPSMQHASAAAVLRSGYLNRSGDEAAPLAVDLSSARVRTALSILDAVRAGQPLGAVFGYRFERELHDRGVDWFIEPLRTRFPAVANKSGEAELEGPPYAIAARSVVDGVALRRAWRDGALDLGHADFFRNAAPPTANERAAVEAELQRLDDALDAVADLLTAESVYQLVGGNTAGANAGLDTMAKGVRPPDPVVAQQPHPGIPLTHRVALVLGGDGLPAAGWGAVQTPRSVAEPWIDGWVGQLFGDPARIRCRVQVAVPGGGSDPPVLVEQEVTLDALGLRPIDVLALARAASEAPAPLSELDQRIAEVALATSPPESRVQAIRYARAPGWSRDQVRTVPEVLEVARAVDRLLTSSRPLAAADLAPPDAASDLPATDPLAGESLQRAEQARLVLTGVRDALGQAIASEAPAAIRQALRVASLLGVPGAFPVRDTTDPDLLAQAASAQAELDHRVGEAGAATTPVAIAQAVFGPGFVFLPRLTPPQANELGLALAAGPALVGEAMAPRRWLYQASRVRAPLGKWRALALRTGLLGAPAGTFDVVQLPHRPNSRWVALPFGPGEEPRARTVSVVLHRLAAPSPNEPWVGLLIDEWNELVPTAAATTGVAFHYDAPGAEAPQAVLIAVPSSTAEHWQLEDLVATLNETLDLAKVRAVDGELLGALGQLVPAVYLAANADNDTVSTDFHQSLVSDVRLALEG